MADQKFSLVCNDFGNNVVNTFENLHTDKQFTDVTLVCNDGEQIKAHKVILSSASELFKQIVLDNPHQHPLLFLKGIKHSDLLAIIEFIYLGSTEVAQNNLGHFMEAASALNIQGLQANIKSPESETREETHGEIDPSLDLDSVQTDEKAHLQKILDTMKDTLDAEVVNTENVTGSHTSELSPITVDAPQDNQKTKYVPKDDGRYACENCDYQTKYLYHLKRHNTGKHSGVKFACDQCDLQFSFRTNLHTHRQSKHEGKRYNCGQCDFENGNPSNLSIHKAKMHKYI